MDWSTAHDPQQDHQFRFCDICCMDIEDSDGSDIIDDITDYTNQTALDDVNSALLPAGPLESSVNPFYPPSSRCYRSINATRMDTY